jgi:hypothetical protein
MPSRLQKSMISLLAAAVLWTSSCSKKEEVDASGGTSTGQGSGKASKGRTGSGKGSGSGSASSKKLEADSDGLTLEQTIAPSVALALADQETVIAMGRTTSTLLHVATSAGNGYVVDLAAGSLTSAAPFSKFDQSTTTTLTVSPAYVWLLFKADNQIGRNKEPPDANKQFEVTKVAVGDVGAGIGELKPLAATDDQLFLFGKDALVVCTFEDSSVNFKSIPLPDEKGLLENEVPLGAGAVGQASEANGFWLVTNKRLMVLDDRDGSARWTVEDLVLEYDSAAPSFVSFYYQLSDDKIERTGTIAALFGGKTINGLDVPQD